VKSISDPIVVKGWRDSEGEEYCWSDDSEGEYCWSGDSSAIKSMVAATNTKVKLKVQLNKNCQSNLLKKNMSTHAYKELHSCPVLMHWAMP